VLCGPWHSLLPLGDHPFGDQISRGGHRSQPEFPEAHYDLALNFIYRGGQIPQDHCDMERC